MSTINDKNQSVTRSRELFVSQQGPGSTRILSQASREIAMIMEKCPDCNVKMHVDGDKVLIDIAQRPFFSNGFPDLVRKIWFLIGKRRK